MNKLVFIGIGIVLILAALFVNGCVKEKTNSIEIRNLSFEIETGSNPVLGNKSAPGTIVEFTEYRCPFCKKHKEETFPKLKHEYVDTGKVKYYLRDFPFSFRAENAAQAARCANEHGKFWEMHDLLFEKQYEWKSLSEGDLETEFNKYVLELGINNEAFSSCYKEKKFSSRISGDAWDGQEYGISGTPSSIIIFPENVNETKIFGFLKTHSEYVEQGGIYAGKTPQGKYAIFISGALPYNIFQDALEIYFNN